MSEPIRLKKIRASEYQYKDWNISDTGIWWMIRNSKNESYRFQSLKDVRKFLSELEENDMSKQYTYEVEEQSVDVRHFKVKSNVKLTYHEVQQIYGEVDFKDGDTSHDLQNFIDWENQRFTDDEIKNIKVSAEFVGTEYGDDCQLDIEGDFNE